MTTDATLPQYSAAIREVFGDDPRLALELAIARTAEAEAEKDKLVAENSKKARAEVLLGEDGKFDVKSLDGLWRLASVFADSGMIPDHFKGNPNGCAVAINVAFRWGYDPLMVLQKCYVVHGRPGFESPLVIARANTSGVLTGRIRYKLSGQGDSRQCVASAIIAETGEEISEVMSVAIAKKMGWWDKKDRKGELCSLWPKMTDLMLKYRSAAWLIRSELPEVLMGVYTSDELSDMDEAGVSGLASGEASGLAKMLKEKADTSADSFPQPPTDEHRLPNALHTAGGSPYQSPRISPLTPREPPKAPEQPSGPAAEGAKVTAEAPPDDLTEYDVFKDLERAIPKAEDKTALAKLQKSAETVRDTNEISGPQMQELVAAMAKREKQLDPKFGTGRARGKTSK